MFGDGKGPQFMHLLWNSLHPTLQTDVTTAQAATLSSSKSALLPPIDQANAVRPQEILLFSIIRAGLLEPHLSESCTWRNRDFIRTLCMR
jgi:hypothetical protein